MRSCQRIVNVLSGTNPERAGPARKLRALSPAKIGAIRRSWDDAGCQATHLKTVARKWEDSPEGWPQSPTHSFLRTDEHGAPMGPRNGGRPVPQWTRPVVTGVGVQTG